MTHRHRHHLVVTWERGNYLNRCATCGWIDEGATTPDPTGCPACGSTDCAGPDSPGCTFRPTPDRFAS